MRKYLFIILLLVYTVSFAGYYRTPGTFGMNENGSKESWDFLEASLLSDKDKNINLSWGGTGGRLDLADHFIYILTKLQNYGHIITLNLTKNAWSAHAVVACYTDKITGLDKHYLVFHPVSCNGEVCTAQEWDYSRLEPCILKGILTKRDVIKSLTNTEVWVKIKNGVYTKIYKRDRRLY